MLNIFMSRKYLLTSVGFEPVNFGSRGEHVTLRTPRPIAIKSITIIIIIIIIICESTDFENSMNAVLLRNTLKCTRLSANQPYLLLRRTMFGIWTCLFCCAYEKVFGDVSFKKEHVLAFNVRCFFSLVPTVRAIYFHDEVYQWYVVPFHLVHIM